MCIRDRHGRIKPGDQLKRHRIPEQCGKRCQRKTDEIYGGLITEHQKHHNRQHELPGRAVKKARNHHGCDAFLPFSIRCIAHGQKNDRGRHTLTDQVKRIIIQCSIKDKQAERYKPAVFSQAVQTDKGYDGIGDKYNDLRLVGEDGNDPVQPDIASFCAGITCRIPVLCNIRKYCAIGLIVCPNIITQSSE